MTIDELLRMLQEDQEMTDILKAALEIPSRLRGPHSTVAGATFRAFWGSPAGAAFRWKAEQKARPSRCNFGKLKDAALLRMIELLNK
nr:MAG TPA: hypothetical protein [Caudoviricetes sp.]